LSCTDVACYVPTSSYFNLLGQPPTATNINIKTTTPMQRAVIKRDGKEQPFRTQKIINAIFEIIQGLDVEDDYELVFLIMKELDLKVPERVTTEELDRLVLKAIEQLIPKHPVYDTLATRQLLKLINKEINRRLNS